MEILFKRYKMKLLRELQNTKYVTDLKHIHFQRRYNVVFAEKIINEKPPEAELDMRRWCGYVLHGITTGKSIVHRVESPKTYLKN